MIMANDENGKRQVPLFGSLEHELRELTPKEFASIFYVMLQAAGGKLDIPLQQLERVCAGGSFEAVYDASRLKYFLKANGPKKKRSRGLIKPRVVVPS